MNPVKLAKFSQKTMIPTAADKYLRNIVEEEMPHGLKQCLEVELFPQIHQKVVKGITIETARQFIHQEGFCYVEHKKGLYYDGHEQPDVVEYRQKVFIPQMDTYHKWLVEYRPDNLEEEVTKLPDNYVEPCLVLVPQDEMTAQANNGLKKSWVPDGEQPLKKKGVGRGIHQSDVICATVGYVKKASQSMEYGKNCDGYWDGAMFVNQMTSHIIFISRVLCPEPIDRFIIKSSWHLSMLMVQVIKHSSWSTILRNTVCMLKMLYWFPA